MMYTLTATNSANNNNYIRINKMIYQQMNKHQMMNDLMSDGYASWTYDQAEALAEHIEESSIDSEWEWDSVALRCSWSGYSSIEEAREDYTLDDDENLEDYTTVLYCGDDYLGEVVIEDF